MMTKKPSHPLLDTLKSDLRFYNDALKEVSADIITEDISKYPVFVAHRHRVKLGEMILDKDELERQWSINATTLEDLVIAGVVQPDKVQLFKETYKDPKRFMCIFLVWEKGGNFIWVPYIEEQKSKPDPSLYN